MEWIKFTKGFYNALPGEQRATRQHLFQTWFASREPPGTARGHPGQREMAGKNSPMRLNRALIRRRYLLNTSPSKGSGLGSPPSLQQRLPEQLFAL